MDGGTACDAAREQEAAGAVLTERSDALTALLATDHPRKRAARDWAAEALTGRALDRATWRRCGDAGLFAMRVPEEYGGLGHSAVEALLTFEGLGLGCDDTGLVFALGTQVFAFGACFVAGATEEQRARHLPGLLAGDTFPSFAMTEPAAGSDSSAITTRATPVDGGYVLDGTKCWITLGPVCDLAIVFASTAPERGVWGITAFLVAAGTPGFTASPPVPKLGLASAPFGELRFDRCFVPTTDRLGPEGAGSRLFSVAVEAERAYLYAAQLGATERLLGRCIDRSASRQQFGQPIGAHQAVAHGLADLACELEQARLLVYKAGALADAGRPVAAAAAMAKIKVADMAVRSAVHAIGLFGAEGYTVAAGLDRPLLDAVGGIAYSGTPEVSRNIIARALGVGRTRRST